jgi:hypothetical protein
MQKVLPQCKVCLDRLDKFIVLNGLKIKDDSVWYSRQNVRTNVFGPNADTTESETLTQKADHHGMVVKKTVEEM